MARRSIGQERFGLDCDNRARSSLDALNALVDWDPICLILDGLYRAAKGEPAWPPLAMFKALLLSVWYDLSDVNLAEHSMTAPRSVASVAFPAVRACPSEPRSCGIGGFWYECTRHRAV